MVSINNIISKLSQDLGEQLRAIAGMNEKDGGGKNTGEIDSHAEYSKLCELLSGQQGYEKDVLSGLKIDYEEEKLVGENVKSIVFGIVSAFGEKTLADFKSEIKALRDILRVNKQQFNQYEVAYIERVIKGEEVKMVQSFPYGNAEEPTKKEPTEKQPKPRKVEDGVDSEKSKENGKTELPVNNEPNPDKPVDEVPTTPVPKEPTVPAPAPQKPAPTTPKPAKPKAPKPIKPNPELAKRPHIDIPDAEKGERLGEEMNKELHRFHTSDSKVISLLANVDSKNAYNFFKELELNENLNPSEKPFVTIMENSNNRPLSEMLKPLRALLAQAKEFGLENNKAYITLQTKVNDMQGSVNLDNRDTNKIQELKIDNAIRDLVREMDKVLRQAIDVV